MPQFEGRAGGTYVDPFTSKMPPRLFATTLAAKNALKWWSKGRYVRSHVTGGFDDPYIDDSFKTTPVEGRDVSQWEIRPAIIGDAEQ